MGVPAARRGTCTPRRVVYSIENEREMAAAEGEPRLDGKERRRLKERGGGKGMRAEREERTGEERRAAEGRAISVRLKTLQKAPYRRSCAEQNAPPLAALMSNIPCHNGRGIIVLVRVRSLKASRFYFTSWN